MAYGPWEPTNFTTEMRSHGELLFDLLRGSHAANSISGIPLVTQILIDSRATLYALLFI